MRSPTVLPSLRASRAPASGLAALVPTLALAASALAACGGAEKPARFPKREAGCDVQVFQAAPGVPTENIGSVQATCDDFVADAECLRTLKDEVCKLGGDVVWGVDETPRVEGSKKTFSGRAAHTAPGGA